MSQPADEDARYRAALDALAARGRFGIRLGLGRTRALLRRLGDPQSEIPGALIGGTNGKGSVQALVAAALRTAGHRVGQTPKPHLVSYRERLVVDGRLISAAEFAELLEEVLGHADAIARRLGPPTEFEVLTAAAFTWFRRSGVDVAVVEVGMGGRLDATNAWSGGVSAITNVALDHTEYLGPTIPDIAREKAAIIKRGDRAAVTAADSEALPIISRRARRVGVSLRRVDALPVIAMDRAGLLLRSPDRGELRVGLVGRHQSVNAAIALAVLDELERAGICRVDEAAVRAGLAKVRWPGRLELLALAADGTASRAPTDGPDAQNPDLLLDGAHNPHGAHALAQALEELRPLLSGGRMTLLMGVLRDKDVAAMLAALGSARAVEGARIVTTAVPGSRRSMPASELAGAWRDSGATSGSIESIGDPGEALERATDCARQDGGPLVICGSLYLVGFARGRLVIDEAAAGD